MFAGIKEAQSEKEGGDCEREKHEGLQEKKIGKSIERKGREKYKVSLPLQTVSLNIQEPLEMNTSISISTENVICNEMQIYSQTSQVAFTQPECSHANLTKQ